MKYGKFNETSEPPWNFGVYYERQNTNLIEKIKTR